ncbi:MAG: hypothetical protein AAGE52_21620 [Myxococcota bacterium]
MHVRWLAIALSIGCGGSSDTSDAARDAGEALRDSGHDTDVEDSSRDAEPTDSAMDRGVDTGLDSEPATDVGEDADTRDAPLLAFPGAVGFGRNAEGGRAGEVLYVTTLADSGPGSLREALLTPGARTIIFRVAGTIALDSRIRVTEPFITLAGQSAPGGGIAIRHSGAAGFGNGLLQFDTHDVIVRHVRFRRGPSAEGECCGDNVTLVGGEDAIFDHCSMSWSTDEILNGFPASRITVQECMLTEPLRNSTHEEEGMRIPHNLGPLFGAASNEITFYRNLFTHSRDRNPRLAPTMGGDFQVVNNVVYNVCSGITIRATGETARVNVIANVNLRGPDSCWDLRGNILLRDNLSVFVEDNLMPLRAAGGDEWMATSEPGSVPASRDRQSLVRHDMPTLPTLASSALVADLFDGVGATLPVRDDVDTRTIREVRDGSGSMIDDPSDVGGWPTLAAGTPYPDGDRDGMDDDWERAEGFDPESADGSDDRDGDGYTNLEEFLNGTRP